MSIAYMVTLCLFAMAMENGATPANMYEVPKEALKQRINKLLKDLFLEEKANTTVSNLSGGMKRRLNLAMAVIHEPEVVVLDEPSEGLDPQSRRVLWNYIKSLRDDEGKTVILTTHLMFSLPSLILKSIWLMVWGKSFIICSISKK